MVNIAWATDIHLDATTEEARRAFYADLVTAAPEFLLLAGDIGRAETVETYLREIAGLIDRPVYFVLGNHDYYDALIPGVEWKRRFGSIGFVRANMSMLSAR